MTEERLPAGNWHYSPDDWITVSKVQSDDVSR
jgi:hypothetical protein